MQGRIQSIDVLRGLAAMAVVVWHWRHFGAGPMETWPFYLLLKPIYEVGDQAVTLFFAISGFIFFLLYSEAIGSGRTGGWKFFVLRFSRIYPLHLATLIAAAIMQMIYLQQNGHCLIFRCSVQLFLEQLILEPNWFSHKMSFNGPSWSISVETAIYFIFFWLARYRLLNAMTMSGLAILCYVSFNYSLLGHGAAAFFAGGLAASVVEKRSVPSPSDWIAMASLVMAVVARSLFVETREVAPLLASAIVFPTIIALIFLADRHLKIITDRLEWLGCISYSVYLLHFPLQLLLLTALPMMGIDVDYTSKAVFVAFFAVVIAISLASYFYFERPVMHALRQAMLPDAKDHAGTSAPTVAQAQS